MKKQWISVKCGLSRDPKHRQIMGESVWLFLHMLDTANWNTGISSDWKDEAAAEDMEMPIRTLREHRRKLAEAGYITCNQKQYTQDIVIHNWTNPREYSGKKYNIKQGDTETSPEENQGYTQGYIQGSTQDVTPTYSSNTKESIPKKSFSKPTARINRTESEQEELDEKKNAWLFPANQTEIDANVFAKEAVDNFESCLHFNPLPWSSNREWERFEKFVVDEYRKDAAVWQRYDEWRKDKGKYVGALSNKAIKYRPDDFIACFPDFLAHTVMYGGKPRDASVGDGEIHV